MGGMEELLRGMNGGMGGMGGRGGHGGMGMLDGMRAGGLFLDSCNSCRVPRLSSTCV
jgi:hypothetical protein